MSANEMLKLAFDLGVKLAYTSTFYQDPSSPRTTPPTSVMPIVSKTNQPIIDSGTPSGPPSSNLPKFGAANSDDGPRRALGTLLGGAAGAPLGALGGFVGGLSADASLKGIRAATLLGGVGGGVGGGYLGYKKPEAGGALAGGFGGFQLGGALGLGLADALDLSRKARGIMSDVGAFTGAGLGGYGGYKLLQPASSPKRHSTKKASDTATIPSMTPATIPLPDPLIIKADQGHLASSMIQARAAKKKLQGVANKVR